jgi:hypothetical protein
VVVHPFPEVEANDPWVVDRHFSGVALVSGEKSE